MTLFSHWPFKTLLPAAFASLFHSNWLEKISLIQTKVPTGTKLSQRRVNFGSSRLGCKAQSIKRTKCSNFCNLYSTQYAGFVDYAQICSMADLSASFSEEEHRKFQRFWDLAEGDDVDIEEKFDLFDQYFKTPAEARAYDEWCKFYKEEEMKLFGAPTATPSGSQPESTGPAGPEPEPAPLHVYQERLARVDFSRPHEVAGYVFCFESTHPQP